MYLCWTDIDRIYRICMLWYAYFLFNWAFHVNLQVPALLIWRGGVPNMEVNWKPHKTTRQMNACITFWELKILRYTDLQNVDPTKAHQTNGRWYTQLPYCEHFLTLFSLFVCRWDPPRLLWHVVRCHPFWNVTALQWPSRGGVMAPPSCSQIHA